jgi:hypothetical protein
VYDFVDSFAKTLLKNSPTCAAAPPISLGSVHRSYMLMMFLRGSDRWTRSSTQFVRSAASVPLAEGN